MKRRSMLKAVAGAGAATAFRPSLFGEANPTWRADLLRYLESLGRSDGGYGWDGQELAHLTPTYHVIGCYRVLGENLPNKPALEEFVRTHHPAALKKLEQERRIFEFQQVQALVWLGADTSTLKSRILAWNKPVAYLKQYEQHGYPLFSSEMGVIMARALLGVPAGELPTEFISYLDSRRRANRSFNSTPAADGSDGHVVNTWWGLQCLHLLGRSTESKEQTIAWLRACQLPSGGFTFQPKPEFAGVDDVAYTRAAVCALKLLGATPSDAVACVSWLQSLANSDGGFGDRPGWQSTPMATHYALEALDALGALDRIAEARRHPAPPRSSLPAGLKFFSLQLEAHGQGSPLEAVDLARSLRIHMWGAKNAKPGWIERAQGIADRQQVPVKFFTANEEYGTWVDVPGLGTYSHTSDIAAPAGASIGPALTGKDAASWADFRQRRLAPLERGDGRLIWQFGENEELVRMFLDDSLERGGYAAISTYHFGNPDFTNSEPFLHRWRGRIPFVALQDAHGPEPWWWSDMTAGFRTGFLATEPTWQGWLNALKNQWVVAIRRDQWTTGKTWMHAGSREVLDFVRARQTEWRWWDNPGIQRPLVSLVALRPDDEFETARPEKGVTLRVRCAWQNTPQGLLKQPLSEFLKLTLDGAEVTATLVARKKANGPLHEDHYHFLTIPDPAPGEHTARVVVRVLATGEEHSRTLSFTA